MLFVCRNTRAAAICRIGFNELSIVKYDVYTRNNNDGSGSFKCGTMWLGKCLGIQNDDDCFTFFNILLTKNQVNASTQFSFLIGDLRNFDRT